MNGLRTRNFLFFSLVEVSEAAVIIRAWVDRMLGRDHEETGGRGDHKAQGFVKIINGLRTFTGYGLGE